VPKASVLVKGATSGVSTDDNGNFEIVVLPMGRSSYRPLIILFEYRVAGRPSIEIVLAASTANSLNEVVVVGYGTRRKAT